MSNFKKLDSFSIGGPDSDKNSGTTDFRAFKMESVNSEEKPDASFKPAGFTDFSEEDFDFSGEAPSSAAGFSRLSGSSSDLEAGTEGVEEQAIEEDSVNIADLEMFNSTPVSAKASNREYNAIPVQKKAVPFRPLIIGGGVLVCIAAVICCCAFIFGQPSAPYPVSNGIEELTQANAETLFGNSFGDVIKGKQVVVDTEGKTYTLTLDDYGFAYAPGGKVAEEYINTPLEDGSGYSVEKISAVGNISFNESRIYKFINQVASEYGEPMMLPHYTIDGDVLTVYSGVDGMSIDFTDLTGKLADCIKNLNFSPMSVALGVLQAPEVDMEQIYNEVACEPVDASYELNEAGTITYVDEVVGKDFDLAAATVQVKTEAEKWDIKLTLTNPKVTVKSLKAPSCPDLLSTSSTKYNKGNANRSNNLELSAQLISGLVLQPGEVFSFNGTVGKRTAARGFKSATVYTGEGLDEDYGGGICQTSTTLYGACLQANLEIVERKNHYYTVGYWKMAGTDATVSWGSCDYKFKNNKEYPIKVVFECHNGTITCKIYGTDDGYSAYMENEVYNRKPYETIHKPKDGSKSNTSGSNGMTVKTYRVVCKNGEVVSRTLEAKSVYKPLNAVVYDGETGGTSSTTSKTTTTKTTTQTTSSTTTTTTTTTTNDGEIVG